LYGNVIHLFPGDQVGKPLLLVPGLAEVIADDRDQTLRWNSLAGRPSSTTGIGLPYSRTDLNEVASGIHCKRSTGERAATIGKLLYRRFVSGIDPLAHIGRRIAGEIRFSILGRRHVIKSGKALIQPSLANSREISLPGDVVARCYVC